MIRELKEKDVLFRIEARPEEISVKGNASAIDEETDKETEDMIYAELLAGNIWAWCYVIVTAEWKGFEGHDTLGACSYKDEKAFCEPGGYFDDMKNEALKMLNAVVFAAHSNISRLEV